MDSFSLPDIEFEGPVIEIPDPPEDLPYEQFDDYRHEQTLLANGFELDPESLMEALAETDGVLRAAVAHTLGARGVAEAMPALREALSLPADYIQVEAAWALIRLGDITAMGTLAGFLDLPVDGFLAPMTAAGFLAQVDDPRGLPLIERALASGLVATRMLACKQLYHFARLRERAPGSIGTDAIARLFEIALADASEDVQWQALVQLEKLRSTSLRDVVERYLAATDDEPLRASAQRILDAM